MAIYYVSSIEDVHGSTGNAGTTADPMGLQEAVQFVVAGDEIRVMDDGDYFLGGSSLLPLTSGAYDNPIRMMGANASGEIDGSRPYIYTADNINTGVFAPIAGRNYWFIQYFHLRSQNRSIFLNIQNSYIADITGETNGSSGNFTLSSSGCVFERCSFSSNNTSYFCSSGFAQSRTFIDCIATNVQHFYTLSSTGRKTDTFIRCAAIGTTSHGFNIPAAGTDGQVFINCSARACGGNGFHVYQSSANGQVSFHGCVSYGNTGDGFMAAATATGTNVTIIDSISIGNGGYGFNNEVAMPAEKRLIRCYGHNNTSGIGSNWQGDPIGLGQDPFVSGTTDNLLLTNNSGATILSGVTASRGNGSFEPDFPFRVLSESLGVGTRIYM
jgi:hypothetical protein